jgi:NAD(P)-dependent dehydrogenase (short-subunit alcohol dehydrogenase family)
MNSLKGKTIAIIGGSAGMGLGIAQAAVSAGANVIIGGRSEAKLNAALEKLGKGAKSHKIDSSDESSVKVFFEFCGGIDHLAIPGSSVKTGPFKETPLENVLYSINNKFVGPMLCAKHALLNEGGSIVFFSGILAERPGDSSLLGAINAAVETLAKGLAIELAPLRVNVVSPGMTEGTDAYLKLPEAAREGMFQQFREKLPTRRVGTPEDMAHAALFLMENPFVTGHVLAVDGGGLVS